MDIQEQVAQAVGAAVAELAAIEHERALDALARTDPRRWSTLEWIALPIDLRCRGVWPRAIACRWAPA